MTLQAVDHELCAMADRSEWKAKIARDARQATRHTEQAAQIRELQRIVSGAIVELDQYRNAVQTIKAPKAIKAKAAPKAATSTLDALQFWQLHADAVTAIKAVYGTAWRCKAPIGETLLVSLTKYRTFTTERGTKLRWNRDHRMPAARFWLNGELPAGLEITPDYARAPMIRADKITDRMVAVDTVHSAVWHVEHGYVLCRFVKKTKPAGAGGGYTPICTPTTDWVNGLEVQAYPAIYTIVE